MQDFGHRFAAIAHLLHAIPLWFGIRLLGDGRYIDMVDDEKHVIAKNASHVCHDGVSYG